MADGGARNESRMPPLPSGNELGVVRLVHHERVASTMDEAHRLAEDGADAGTCVIADEQTAGRGRGGRAWSSAEGQGVWLTLVERPTDVDAVDVLSLRLGLAIARVLDPLVDGGGVLLKWPNDVYVRGGKVAGVLVEARWRRQSIEWVAIGVGINLHRPQDVPNAAGLSATVDRNAVLRVLLPGLRRAASRTGWLSESEIEEWARRDLARGRMVTQPLAGVVRGITETGAIQVADAETGRMRNARSGSLVFADEG